MFSESNWQNGKSKRRRLKIENLYMLLRKNKMCNKETFQKLFSSQLLSNPSPPLTLRAHISLRMLAIFEFQQLFMKRRYKSPVNKFINLIVNTLRMRDRSQDVSRGVYLNPRARRHKWGGGGGQSPPRLFWLLIFVP